MTSPGIMLDTMIVSYAIRSALNRRPAPCAPEEAKRYSDSHFFVFDYVDQKARPGEPSLYISSVTWFELVRAFDDEEHDALRPVLSRLRILAFDTKAADRAAELYRASRERLNLCRRCFGTQRTEEPCPQCSRPRSRQQRMNDIMIAAHADTAAEVHTLYTFDKGMVVLNRFTRITIAHPDQVYQTSMPQVTAP